MHTVIAERLGIGCQHTAGRWRKRFASGRVDGLFDEPRPGAPRTIGDAEIAETIRRTLETMPADATHGSLRCMAKTAGLAPSAIHRIWKAFGLQPHRTGTCKLSTDPLVVEKVRDIAGLYLNLPERAVVLWVDAKSQIQALDRTQPLLPMRLGQVERHTHADVRHGTTSLLSQAKDCGPRCRRRKSDRRCFARHRAAAFGKFLATVEKAMPKGLDVHAGMANSSTHKTKLIRDGFAKRRTGACISRRHHRHGSIRSSASSLC